MRTKSRVNKRTPSEARENRNHLAPILRRAAEIASANTRELEVHRRQQIRTRRNLITAGLLLILLGTTVPLTVVLSGSLNMAGLLLVTVVGIAMVAAGAICLTKAPPPDPKPFFPYDHKARRLVQLSSSLQLS
mgnify:CR=1 FL=1